MKAIRYLMIGLSFWGSALWAQEKADWLKTLGKAAAGTSSDEGEKPATVAGTRGLNESSTPPTDTESRDDAAIARLEKVKVAPLALKQFIKEGELK